MKLTGKLITFFIVTCMMAFAIVCFFWASSPNYSQNEYSNLITNNYVGKSKKDSVFSVITYNIGYLSGMTNNKAIAKPKELFDTNLKKVKKEFELLNADIIAFQEIDYASARSYKVNQQNEISHLGYNYVAQAVNWDETYVPFPYWPPSLHFGEMFSGQSILSKYPLKDHHRIVMERVKGNLFYRDALYLERLAQVVTVTIDNKDVIIINVHLEAYDKSTRVNQLNTVIDLFNTCRKEYPTILLGDFNSTPTEDNSVIQKMIDLDGVGNAAFGETYDYTYNTENPSKRIDYIFYTKNSIELIDSKVLKQFGEASDHLPIEMEFRLK